jgi:uncharacterized protein (DUF58 family)
MRHAAGVALTTSAMFLAVVAIMLNSGALFYMSTAIIATIMASHIQAYLSVRGLHFDRQAPETAKVGELVTVDITVWSDRRIRRPLISVIDALPSKLVYTDRTPSLPIAPAFDVPIKSQYSFRPLRRGKFHWNGLSVVGTDALGLVSTVKAYEAPPVDILVVPNPLPLDFDVPPAPSYGISESESGQGRGSGIEPRGIREYSSGDSLRYVHWRSSARAGKLLVKEFATGTHASIAFVFQRTRGTEIGAGATTTLEQMCANAAFMTERLLRQGAEICFPTLGYKTSTSTYQDHQQQVLATLASIEADSLTPLSEELEEARKEMPAGGLIYAFIGVADDQMPYEVKRCLASGIQVVAMVYDAAEYVPARGRDAVNSAATVGFCDSLRNAGAQIILVPKPEAL